MPEIDISEIGGFRVRYDARKKVFYLYDNNNKEVDKEGFSSQEKAEARAKALMKNEIKLKDFQCLLCRYDSVYIGRVTSLNFEEGFCWFVEDNGDSYRRDRSKQLLRHNSVFIFTPANRIVYEKITSLRSEIKELENQISELIKTIADPLTEESYRKIKTAPKAQPNLMEEITKGVEENAKTG
ncbi:MAG: hypothetical protein PHN44_00580 [Candidatus Marinimicrobia bacterium]|nr:hypothetical protein [Candidatus Neomarinimicrobiota bacterium]MDD5539139.1 hypothetical protein [Candidatus Neomarinimicrobiota bacterium]